MANPPAFAYPINPPTPNPAPSLAYCYPVGLEVIWQGSDFENPQKDKQGHADIITLLLSIAAPHGYVRAHLRANTHLTTTVAGAQVIIGPHLTVNFQSQANIAAGTYVGYHIFVQTVGANNYILAPPPGPAPGRDGTNPEMLPTRNVVGPPSPDKYLANPPRIPPPLPTVWN